MVMEDIRHPGPPGGWDVVCRVADSRQPDVGSQGRDSGPHSGIESLDVGVSTLEWVDADECLEADDSEGEPVGAR